MNQLDFEGNFPYDRYPVMRVGQKMAFDGINADRARKVFHTVIEAPVGSGKTGMGYTYLRPSLYSFTDGRTKPRNLDGFSVYPAIGIVVKI